jgi:hypothetical protein
MFSISSVTLQATQSFRIKHTREGTWLEPYLLLRYFKLIHHYQRRGRSYDGKNTELGNNLLCHGGAWGCKTKVFLKYFLVHLYVYQRWEIVACQKIREENVMKEMEYIREMGFIWNVPKQHIKCWL